jgi:hypothetical protein
MIEIALKELWMTLTPAEIEDACLAFWEGAGSFSLDAQPRVVKALAEALRFRESFLKRLTFLEKARHLRRLVDTPTLQHLCDEVLRAWLVARKNPMLVCFVEAQGLQHSGGIIDDTVNSPTPEVLRKGIRAVRDHFPARDVALYMGVMLVSAGDFWTGLADIVAVEIPSLKADLATRT